MAPVPIPAFVDQTVTSLKAVARDVLNSASTTKPERQVSRVTSTGQDESYVSLEQGWSFTQLEGYETDKDGQLVNASGSSSSTAAAKELGYTDIPRIPTSVHVELQRAGKIPDPFKRLNEHLVQWVGEADWRFKTTFDVSAEQLAQPNVDLVFEGLDTFCRVELNGKEVLYADNMFIPHRVPAKHLLKPQGNSLVLTFPSAWIKGKQIEAAELERNLACNRDVKTGEQGKKLGYWNGDSSRLYVRKAQYGYGWDWGPVLMTCGPWRPIKVHSYCARVLSNRIDIELEAPYTQPKLRAEIEVDAVVEGEESGSAVVSITSPDGKVLRNETQSLTLTGKVNIDWSFAAGEVDLWWPVGEGAQPLYTLRVDIQDGAKRSIASRVDRVGFRSARVVQEALLDGEPGTSFLFEINGRRLFIGGSNWIPADSFLTEITPDRYRAWLQLMLRGNQNMVRVWGGGVYEDPCFYDACDEMGLLVWQDFMFGCGQYPAFDSLVSNVQREAEHVVDILRNRPSVVLFAGNNEDYALAEGLELDLDTPTSGDLQATNFPARHIYEKTLPEVVARLSNIYYQPSSPYGGRTSADQTVGDIHQWNVWHGSQEPWHNWDKLAGRFISEFGMEGYPDIRTVDHWLDGDVAERFPQSRTVCSHNKADGFERRLELYLMENFRHAFDMDSYVYYTQAMQAETLAAAYRLWRRNWRGPGRELTSGALVWQINDCWPTTSWAIADYFMRPKPAFFAIARELRRCTVGMARKDVREPSSAFSAAHYTIRQKLEVWGTNAEQQSRDVKLEIVAFDLDAGREVERWTRDVTLAANSSTELWNGDVPGQPVRRSEGEVPKVIVVGARLLDAKDGSVLSRYANWPEPWKYVHFPEDAGLKIEVEGDGERVKLSSAYPIKAVVLDVESPQHDDSSPIDWSDQAIDLMPHDPQTISVRGLNGRKIVARYLGDGSA